MLNLKTTMKRARRMGGSAMRPFSLLPGWMAALLTVALVPMIPAQTPPPAPSAGFMSIEIPYGNADPTQVRAILKDLAKNKKKYKNKSQIFTPQNPEGLDHMGGHVDAGWV